MEPSTIPVTSIKTGVIQEERSFDWEISNFPVVLKHSAMIKSQQFEFHAGGSIGMDSKWEAFLQDAEMEGRTWIGIFIGVKERPKPVLTSENLCVQFVLTFKDKAGGVKRQLESTVRDWHDVKQQVKSVGFPQVIDVNGDLPRYVELNDDGSLVVHVKFRLFGLSKTIQPLKVKLEEFEVKSTARAREDLATMLMGVPLSSNDVKIIGNDKKEFKMRNDILSARSPVFRAMLEADMTEGNAGLVKIEDMGSESLKVMLHFLNRGKLLPGWSSSEVLVELTNAAAKYELTDLLHFLDGVLGNVCNLDNVGALILLASRLSLKSAEGELLSFLRRKGVSSIENFIQVSNGILASESRAEEELSSGSNGSSGDQIEGEGRPTSMSGSCSCACCRRRQGEGTMDEVEEDNEADKSKGKPPKKARRGRNQK